MLSLFQLTKETPNFIHFYHNFPLDYALHFTNHSNRFLNHHHREADNPHVNFRYFQDTPYQN